MKISKLLNKKYFLFFLFFILSSETIANEPVDIWNIDKTKADIESNSQNDTVENSVISEESISVYDLNNNNNDQKENVQGGNSAFKIERGVQQGDIISPILFNAGLEYAIHAWKIRIQNL